jgi:modulator of FtsH protease
MDAYSPDAWHDFFVAAAGAAAALTGLLFVALSLHIRYIVSEPTYRSMARGSLIGLVMVLILSFNLLVRQPALWTGIELAGVAGLYVVGEGGYEVITWQRQRWQVPRPTVVRSGVAHLLALIGAIGGAGIVFQVGPGLYAVAFIAVAIIVWNLWNSWVLLMGVADEEIAQEAR